MATTVVFRFGVASWWQAPKLVFDQLYWGHQVGNRLVAIANGFETAKAAHWSEFPDVAAVEDQLTQAAETVADLKQQVAELRQQIGHLKHIEAPRETLQAAQVNLREALAELRHAQQHTAALKTQRQQAIGQRWQESKAALAALGATRTQQIKDLYPEFCQDQDRALHYASFWQIVDHHELARKRIGTDRAGGRAAQLRFHPWDGGTGAITVKLMRNAWVHGCARKGPPWPCATEQNPRPAPSDCPQRREKDPVRSPALLASGAGKWANTFRLEPWTDDAEGWQTQPRSQRRGTAVLGLSGGRLVHVPVFVDQMIPPEADIPMVELVRSEQAGQLVWHLCVTATLPDPEPAPDTAPTAAVHLGWRKRPDGHIRVGVITSDQPLPAPPAELTRPASSSPGRKPDASSGTWKPHHRPYLERTDTGGWEIVVPAQLWDVVGRPAAIHSHRDQLFNTSRDKLAAWLVDHPDHADPLGVDLTQVKAWRSPRRLAGLVRGWDPSPKARARGVTPPPDLPAQFAAELLPELVAWWRRDLHLMRNERGEQHDLRARRDDTWKQIGAWLGAALGHLVVGDEDYRQLRRRPDPNTDTDPPMPTTAQEKTRARASFVAPGLLRSLLAGAAARRGVPVIKVPAKGLTRIHAECGHQAGPDPQYAQRIVVDCPGCGAAYDQDHNAVHLMLQRANP